MFKWLRKLFPSFDIYEEMDKVRERNNEVWHYTCENGHKWKSYSSPRGTFLYGEKGQTKCPECKTPICQGAVYINGKYAQMGAMHVDFGKKRKCGKIKKS